MFLGLMLLFHCAWDEDAFGVLSPGGITPTGEQSMHFPGGEEQDNQTREKIHRVFFQPPGNGGIWTRSSRPCPDRKIALVCEVEGFMLKQ